MFESFCQIANEQSICESEDHSESDPSKKAQHSRLLVNGLESAEVGRLGINFLHVSFDTV